MTVNNVRKENTVIDEPEKPLSNNTNLTVNSKNKKKSVIYILYIQWCMSLHVRILRKSI